MTNWNNNFLPIFNLIPLLPHVLVGIISYCLPQELRSVYQSHDILNKSTNILGMRHTKIGQYCFR